MDFFNSVFTDDPEPSNSPRSPSNYPSETESENPNAERPNRIPESSSTTSEDPDSVWSFGSVIKTITTRSESLIGNYRRDFEEFGSGLLKETALIRDVASRAVHEFPDSIDSGASVAQESLETVGQAIDNLGSSVWERTSKILARGKELQLFDDEENDDLGNRNNAEGNLGAQSNERLVNVKRYSWFDTRMCEIQGDPRTYTEEPDDLEDYKKWKSGFSLEENGDEIEKLMEKDRVVERIYLDLVPVTVDRQSFWSRYFYKVNKLKQAEESRARILKRAISRDVDDEDLSWDVDDDADSVPSAVVSAESTSKSGTVKDMQGSDSNQEDDSKNVDEISEVNVDAEEKRCDEVKVSVEKNDSDSSKDSDLSIISTQPSLPGEEELEWDEIENVGCDDGNKITASSSLNTSDFRNRLNTADEDEDLSWDIEDDEDEHIKS